MPQFLDFATFERLPPRKSYLLAPEGLCQNAVPDGPGEIFRRAPEELVLALRTHLETAKGVTRVEANIEACAVRFVAVTPLMRFKDDVDLRILPHDEGSVAAIYSRSRVGYRDLGANKKRVDALVASLRRP